MPTVTFILLTIQVCSQKMAWFTNIKWHPFYNFHNLNNSIDGINWEIKAIWTRSAHHWFCQRIDDPAPGSDRYPVERWVSVLIHLTSSENLCTNVECRWEGGKSYKSVRLLTNHWPLFSECYFSLEFYYTYVHHRSMDDYSAQV